jgi:hypothetical protein
LYTNTAHLHKGLEHLWGLVSVMMLRGRGEVSEPVLVG